MKKLLKDVRTMPASALNETFQRIVNRQYQKAGRRHLTPIFVAWLIAATIIIGASSARAFCGFYVAKADASLFNKTSQVILVREGNRTTITMSSDFEGDAKILPW